MGVGGVMEIIEQERRERVLYFFVNVKSYWVFSVVCFSGGILGSDDVRTTCIPDEMMMRL